MPFILENSTLQIQIDLPHENYQFSRFDWSGKITKVEFRKISFCGTENAVHNNYKDGQGFYNEFGIDRPLGFDETAIGGWFHKIGIGLLQKDSSHYDFMKDYEIQPNSFNYTADNMKLEISTESKIINGYGYRLGKRIEIKENGFIISYRLHNIGDKPIITNEYDHNFISINGEPIGSQYILKFPFELRQEAFEETVNPENKVEISKNEIHFNQTPKKPFFFSNLTGGQRINPSWELNNSNCNLGIRESVNIESDKINLWGWGHVISPEIYIDINLMPGHKMNWSRKYDIYKF